MASVDRIAMYRREFQEAGFALESTRLFMRTYPYYVIPPDWKKLPPTLPKLFAFQMAPPLEILESQPPEECTLFGVSGAIQKEYRPLVVLHEVHEYVENVLQVARSCRMAQEPIPDRPSHACAKASMAEYVELQNHPDEFRRGYIAMRAAFFRDFVAYAEQGGLNPSLLKEFRDSANFWAELEQADDVRRSRRL